MTKQLYDIGEMPPLGEVPEQMHAWLIRPERFGPPMQAFQQEIVDVPEIADDEVLVYVMAAGINYNNVWAGLGIPVDVIGARNKGHSRGDFGGDPAPFHIGGSDASGIVYRVGKDVTNVKVGDEVVMHCGQWSRTCPWVQAGKDPMYSPTFRIWGYETNWGSFAQFTKVQAQQCMPKPKHMTWEEASAYTLIDANQVWEVGEAISWVKALAAFNPYFIEEPTSPDDVEGHLAIRQGVAPIRVATGEMCQNRVLFKQFITRGAIDIAQVDAARLGGERRQEG